MHRLRITKKGKRKSCVIGLSPSNWLCPATGIFNGFHHEMGPACSRRGPKTTGIYRRIDRRKKPTCRSKDCVFHRLFHVDVSFSIWFFRGVDSSPHTPHQSCLRFKRQRSPFLSGPWRSTWSTWSNSYDIRLSCQIREFCFQYSFSRVCIYIYRNWNVLRAGRP